MLKKLTKKKGSKDEKKFKKCGTTHKKGEFEWKMFYIQFQR